MRITGRGGVSTSGGERRRLRKLGWTDDLFMSPVASNIMITSTVCGCVCNIKSSDIYNNFTQACNFQYILPVNLPSNMNDFITYFYRHMRKMHPAVWSDINGLYK